MHKGSDSKTMGEETLGSLKTHLTRDAAERAQQLLRLPPLSHGAPADLSR
jgi:hypothetical protein